MIYVSKHNKKYISMHQRFLKCLLINYQTNYLVNYPTRNLKTWCVDQVCEEKSCHAMIGTAPVSAYHHQSPNIDDTCPVIKQLQMEELNKLGSLDFKPASPLCPACSYPVYPAEGWIGSDRTPFHKRCLKCRRCKKMLSPLTINEHRNNLFCKACYHAVFLEKVDVFL